MPGGPLAEVSSGGGSDSERLSISNAYSVPAGVTGSIANVGNYINGYGESIKRSMSSDGPVSTPQKKTAVKPTGAVQNGGSQAQKALPAAQKTAGGAGQKTTGGANKAISTAGGAAKSPPASAQKTASSAGRSASQASRPATSGVKSAANNASKPAQSTARNASTKPPTSGGGGGPASNTRSGAQQQQQQSNKVQNKSTDGKVKISAASRPKVGGGPAKSTKPPVKDTSGKKHDASDPLGMGGLLGEEEGKKGKK